LILTAQDELERMLARSTSEFVRRVQAIAFEQAKPIPSNEKLEDAIESLGRLIGGTRAVAWMLGRRRVLLESDRMKRVTGKDWRDHQGAALVAMAYVADQTLIPRVDPDEAIADMIERDPRLAKGYKAVQDLLSRERAFAMAKSESLIITERVQAEMGRFLKEGVLHPAAEDLISAIGSWSQAYASTVFRTNMTSAYASGRFREAMSDELRGFIVGLERMEVMDTETRERPGHWAAHGLTASPHDPIWHHLSIPGGYNCRAAYRLVDLYEARRRGLMDGNEMRRASWPAGAFNDDGFANKVMHPSYGLM
jgi:hypothetical protein